MACRTREGADKAQETKKKGRKLPGLTVVIKGAGEMATGVAQRLYMANIRHIVMTEISHPITVRRAVAFSEVVYKGRMTVEGVEAEHVSSIEEVYGTWQRGKIAVIVDPEWQAVEILRPDVVVDVIMAKRNLGTRKDEAPLVIGVGPGFTAPSDVHFVVESNRGHYLGRVIPEGSAEAHTGIPGPTLGYTTERVLRSPHEGIVRHVKKLGDSVIKGETVLYVGETPIYAPIDGMLRGLIREIEVPSNEKIGDIDPRNEKDYVDTITEKARAIGGGVLEAILRVYNVESI
ncbi:selenium-dependent molybdenum cofactor biosynthesis protein YqeB [Syntrophorhabdus aromaticivorans]|uniref:EF2563 family selenium-dependent molybdenum hydroxylase system protein n=1 Tax=Syntrophorhabdus aromaticivorans TaxID=328301 RepID=A0A971S175_9BACT|nr:selenium-dependent molybdenum cofactor biosynthesis protein YqeB [Syntrophorhabdus aromaticivorans]NLW34952.1 EF2563 family selenium-dependent molybdenum hydroxylase system protein [Syntrophorhabdus aromaticivorans]